MVFFLGGGGRGAKRTYWFQQIFPSDIDTKNGFCYVWNFSAHPRFRIKHVLLRIRVAHMWLGYLNYHICYEFCELFGGKLKCLRCFRLWERFLTHGCGIRFLVVHHMLPKCLLFFTQDTLFKMQQVGPYNLHTLVSWLLYLGILCVSGSHHRSDILVMTYSFSPSGQNFGSWSTAWLKLAFEILPPYILCLLQCT